MSQRVVRVEEATSSDMTPPLWMGRLVATATIACGKVMGEITRVVAIHIRIAMSQHKLRKLAPTEAPTNALSIFEGVAPIPSEGVGSQMNIPRNTSYVSDINLLLKVACR